MDDGGCSLVRDREMAAVNGGKRIVGVTLAGSPDARRVLNPRD